MLAAASPIIDEVFLDRSKVVIPEKLGLGSVLIFEEAVTMVLASVFGVVKIDSSLLQSRNNVIAISSQEAEFGCKQNDTFELLNFIVAHTSCEKEGVVCFHLLFCATQFAANLSFRRENPFPFWQLAWF